MPLLQGFVYDIRSHLRRTLLLTAGLVLVIMVALSVVLIGVYYASARVKPPTSGLDPTISVAAFTPGIIQVAGCLRTGPSCVQYDQAKEYMIKASPTAGLTYTPLHANDPGTPEGTQHRLRFTRDTTAAQWKAWADAVTLNGRANPDTVRETNVTIRDKTTGVFLLGERTPPYTGSITFALQQSGVLVDDITYTKG